MKTKVKVKSYDEVMAQSPAEHKKPRRPLFLLSLVVYILSFFETLFAGFTYRKVGMEQLKKGEPFLILMNHSAFLDLKIVSRIFFPRRYTIVTSSDGFIGKRLLMRLIGCISTRKFVSDLTLLKDIRYSLDTLKCPVLMYPEASYSFDGRASKLPDTLGSFLKMMKVPVVTIITEGVFSRDPLYNNLQIRKVKPRATVTYLFSPEQIAEMTADDLNAKLNEVFTFDGFAWQRENRVRISEKFRADGLNRILFRCAHCGKEGGMEGKGTTLTCHRCGKTWGLTEYGQLEALQGDTEFPHIPDWYAWQKEQVAAEIDRGEYLLDCPVDLYMQVDFKAVYKVGQGRLLHNNDGIHITGCDGKLDYIQKPMACYSLFADYYWYEIGDMICVGDNKCLYYCFPKIPGDVVAKARIAAEILYERTRGNARGAAALRSRKEPSPKKVP